VAGLRKALSSLYVRVLIGIALGIVLGLVAPATAAKLEPLAKGFIALVKMTIAPLIFCTVVVGIANTHSKAEVGKAGGLAILYFELASTLALVIGLVIVNAVGPGRGMNVNPASLDTSAYAKMVGAGGHKSVTEFLLGVIPDTFLGGLARGDLLQVLLAALLFGFALQAMGEKGKVVNHALDQLAHVMFGVVGIIMKLAPIGAFGAMAFTIGEYGVGKLASLGELLLCFYATCLVFIFGVLGLVLVFIFGVLGLVGRLHGFSVWRFVRYIKDELFIVLGTSSSESVLPRMMAKLENLGASKPIVGLVVPAGYSFNLDGTAIYVTMGAIFIAQATNTPLDLTHQLGLLGLALLTSKGAAGVTGSGFVTLAATLEAFGDVPAAGLALIFGIDRFMSEARALTNVIGNGVATLVVARWCRGLDLEKTNATLRGAQHESPESIT
jgi:aerobic C4-dicarboxylate transport protein